MLVWPDRPLRDIGIVAVRSRDSFFLPTMGIREIFVRGEAISQCAKTQT